MFKAAWWCEWVSKESSFRLPFVALMLFRSKMGMTRFDFEGYDVQLPQLVIYIYRRKPLALFGWRIPWTPWFQDESLRWAHDSPPIQIWRSRRIYDRQSILWGFCSISSSLWYFYASPSFSESDSGIGWRILMSSTRQKF